MLLATHRAPSAVPRPRGPGIWRDVADADVLVPRRAAKMPGDALDLATPSGVLVFAALAVVIGAATWLLATRVAGFGVALPLAATVLVPLFATGSRAQLPATPPDLAARVLRPARDALARRIDLAHVDLRTVARVVDRAGTFDEVRLVCAPIDRTPGLRSLELAVAVAAPGPHGAIPEVLVRFDDGSPAAARVAAIARASSPSGRRDARSVVPGRTPEEKVVRLVPTHPTPEAAARLLATLIVELEGRRSSDRAAPVRAARPRYAGPERRVRRWPMLAASA
jgi:hypothetical protein